LIWYMSFYQFAYTSYIKHPHPLQLIIFDYVYATCMHSVQLSLPSRPCKETCLHTPPAGRSLPTCAALETAAATHAHTPSLITCCFHQQNTERFSLPYYYLKFQNKAFTRLCNWGSTSEVKIAHFII